MKSTYGRGSDPLGKRWWIGAYVLVTLASTTGWIILGQRLADETGLRRQVWLVNNFQGRPVIEDVTRAATLDFLDDDPRLPREFISARWHGYWYVPSRRAFTLHVQADDYADIWIDGEQLFARSSTAARAVRLDAGVHEFEIFYQQFAGETGLAFYASSGDAYPLPLRTGYLFPTDPEPGLLRLATIVNRLRLTVGILWAVGALGAAVFIVRRWRSAIGSNSGLPATTLTRTDAVALTALCLAMLVYSYGNLALDFASADGLHNLRLGIRLADDGTYRHWPWQVDEHEREPFGPALIAAADFASKTLGLGAVPLECVSDESETQTRSESCRRSYVPYQAANLLLLVLGAVGVFWLVLQLTSSRTLAYLGLLFTAQSAALLASADSFYTEVHAATLMVAVGGLAWTTVTSRRLVHAALLGLALATLVLTKVIFIYLWIPIAILLLTTDLWRRRVDWTTAGLIGVMLAAQVVPVVAWMTRNYVVSGDFSIIERRTSRVLTLRAHFNTMRHDEWLAGFAYYLPPMGESPSLKTIPQESIERFGRNRASGFRGGALRSLDRQVRELRDEWQPQHGEVDEPELPRSVNDEVAERAQVLLLAEPVQHLKVAVLLAWRGAFVEGGLGFLSSPLTQRLADIHSYPAWPRWRRAYSTSAVTVVNLVGLLALFVVPLWLWLGRGRFEAVLIFLPALYAHGAYAVATRFVPRFALPEVPLRIVATLVLLFLVWSSARRCVSSWRGSN